MAESCQSGLKWAVVCTALFFGLILVLFPTTYEVNDDFAMILSLSGLDGFPASPDAPFISRLLSQTLYTLYGYFPLVPWYGVFLYTTAFLGISLIFATLFQEGVDRSSRILILPAWIALLARGVYMPTFTFVSLTLELGVILHLVSWLVADGKFRLHKCLLFCCLVLAYVWRWWAVLNFLAFGLPILFFVKWRPVQWRPLAPVIPYALLFITIVMTDRIWDRVATSSQVHQEFQQYSRLRSRFHDRPEGRFSEITTVAAREKVAWSREDFVMFRRYWILYDDQKFNTETLTTFLQENQAESLPSIAKRLQTSINRAWQNNRLFIPVFGCTALALGLLRRRELFGSWNAPNKKNIAIFIGVGLLIAMLISQRFISRVSVPVMVYVLGLLLVLGRGFGRETEEGFRPKSSVDGSIRFSIWFLFVCNVLFIILLGWLDLTEQSSKRQHWRFLSESLNKFAATTDKPPLLVRLNPNIALRQGCIHPLLERHDAWPDVKIMPGGWAINSPRYKSILRELGSSSGRDFLKNSINSDQVVFFDYILDYGEFHFIKQLWESYFHGSILADSSKVKAITAQYYTKETGETLIFVRFRRDDS